jgi:mannose-6-phosphate isomerase-like protein (cupin superfamily)
MLDDWRDHAGIIGFMPSAIDLTSVFASFSEPWKPRTVAVVNDYDVRIVKVHGEFTAHRHLDTDELFLVMSGSFTIRMEAGDVILGPGQLDVVPKGVQHQPFSADGAEVLLLEPTATVNTGDTPSELTTTPIVL